LLQVILSSVIASTDQPFLQVYVRVSQVCNWEESHAGDNCEMIFM
ncbi:hypothetical protein SOVF_021780, partial [Spinacia oleracea]